LISKPDAGFVFVLLLNYCLKIHSFLALFDDPVQVEDGGDGAHFNVFGIPHLGAGSAGINIATIGEKINAGFPNIKFGAVIFASGSILYKDIYRLAENKNYHAVALGFCGNPKS